MSGRHHGRDPLLDDEAHEGRHRDPHDDRPEGRHRAAAVQRAAVNPLLVASGTLAAAALTAVVLSGQPDSGESPGGPSAQPPTADRPSDAAPGDPAGAPGGTALDEVGSFTDQGLMGSSRRGNAWDALLRTAGGVPGALAALCGPAAADAPLPAVPGVGWSGSPTGSAAPSAGPDRSPAPAGTPALRPDGPAAEHVPTVPAQPVASPTEPEPRAPAGTVWPAPVTPPSDDGGPLPVIEGPPALPAPVLGPVPDPVTRPADPVTAPVVAAVEPVEREVEQVVEDVAEQAAEPEPVEQVAERVVPPEPVTGELPGPADLPSEAAVESLPVDLPG
jgi:hypothetical protein